MPLIQVKLIEGVFDEAQKQTMAQRLTDTMVEIEGENMRGVTWVLVEEVQSGHWPASPPCDYSVPVRTHPVSCHTDGHTGRAQHAKTPIKESP